MLLVYVLRVIEGPYLTVDVNGADIKEGAALRGTLYPRQVDKVLPIAKRSIDKKILMHLKMHTPSSGWQNQSRSKDAWKLLELLCQSNRAYAWNNSDHPISMGETIKTKAAWEELKGLYFPILEAPAGYNTLPSTPPVVIDPETAAICPMESDLPPDLASLWLRTDPMQAEATEAFIYRLAQRYPDAALPLPPVMRGEVVDDFKPVPICRIKNGKQLQLTPWFRYGTREIQADEEFKHVRFVDDAGKVIDAQRNFAFEKKARKRLHDAGFFRQQVQSNDLFGRAEQSISLELDENGGTTWVEAIEDFFPSLEKDGWLIHYEEDFQLTIARENDWYADFTTTGRGLMSFASGVVVDGEQVNLLPFVHEFLRTRRTKSLEQLKEELKGRSIPVPTPTGAVLVSGDRLYGMIYNLFELFGDATLDRNNRLRVSIYRAAELAADEERSNWEPPAELQATVEALKGSLDLQEVSAPEGFKGALRPYQKQGVGWLRFLRQHQLGGILADDMGLGKTVQVIAGILDWRQRGELDHPVMIVAPTSVLPNWRKELYKFAPQLQTVTMHGSERKKLETYLDDCDIILTTYGLLRRDFDLYVERVFGLLVLDEAQAIKNSKSKATIAAKDLNAQTRLALSGTPCENHLGELWSIMDFAQPGFLGSENDFKVHFRKPIEDENCQVTRETLRRRIKPLVLRRTKDLVAADLPPKTEIVQEIPLSDAQADLYQTVRMAMSAKIQDEMEAKGLAKSQLVVLDALLKLRQICCDPRLRDKETEFDLPIDSAKLAWLSQALPEMVEEGRRILLFSQFTSMLDLLKKELKQWGIPYVEIRGSTKDREKPVERFQNGEVPLFLISLKAGGTGLNLTAADTVIHYDPWWNPAAEDQATDRAHRLGQEKPVFVYKLVTEGSIESRILELQKRKKEITDLSSGVTGDGLSFSEDDLEALMAPIG